jgi:hypothetical protein
VGLVRQVCKLGGVVRAVGVLSSQAPYGRVKLGLRNAPVYIDSFGRSRLLLSFLV